MIFKKNNIASIACAIFIMLNSISVIGAVSEKFTMSPKMKQNILISSFKANLRTNEGRNMIAYLYAEDERSELIYDFSCTNLDTKVLSKIGHYYIYLYDVELGSFLPGRTKILTDFKAPRFIVGGSGLKVFSGIKEKKSDVLLISQFGDCSGDFYEAYGFSKNNQSLKQYMFADNGKEWNKFYGKVAHNKANSHYFAYGAPHPPLGAMREMNLYISNKPGVIQVKTVKE